MNLVGKIFVVMIFVMSLVFMSLAMLVYATHQNWMKVVKRPQNEVGPGLALGLEYRLDAYKTENEDLRNQKEQAIKDLETERADKLKALTGLENERDEAVADRRKLQASLATEEKEKRDAVAAMNATQTNATSYRQQLDKLQAEILKAQQDRDKYFQDVVRLTDELNQAENEKEQLRKRLGDLSKDLAKYKELALWLDAPSPDSDYKSKSPPRVNGIVTAVLGDGLIEISIGSDAGLRKGHRLQLSRVSGGTSTYVGRVEVVETAADKSVCKIDSNFQKSHVMEGDRVDSKID